MTSQGALAPASCVASFFDLSGLPSARRNRTSEAGAWLTASLTTALAIRLDGRGRFVCTRKSCSLAMYVSSFPCVVWLAHSHYLSESAVKPLGIFYWPLIWIVNKFEPANSLFVWLCG